LKDWAFYFITDEHLTKKGVIRDVQEALDGGAKVIQYRRKEGDTLEMYKEASTLKKMVDTAGADLIINDRIDVAMAVGAQGVHLGQSDMPLEVARTLMPEGIIGVSVGSLKELERGLQNEASYIAVSPVWETPTKADAGPGLGTTFIKNARKITDIHIAAIGGIKMGNLDEVLSAGADSVCAISATVSVKDTRGAVEAFEKRVREGRIRRV